MDPVEDRDEPLYLAGISTSLPASTQERIQMIQELWPKLMSKAHDIKNRNGKDRYVVIENDLKKNTERPPLYRAMVAVRSFDELPAWCECFTVEPGKYAAFQHKGLARDLSKTVTNIVTNWSDKIPGLFGLNIEIMRLPDGYSPTDPNGSFDYWLPLP